jgi:hypothetical protein
MALSTLALVFTLITALVGINTLEKIDETEKTMFEN